jgi:hypothetical protein
MRRGRQVFNSSITKLLGDHKPPTTQQLKCLNERQQQATTPLLVSTGICRYGHPQVIVFPPVDLENKRTFSGMIRLTCPHLIKEIDLLEKESGVQKFNSEIAPTDEARSDFLEAHQVWNQAKKMTMNSKQVEYVKERFGEDTEAENFFSSGFIGIQMDR